MKTGLQLKIAIAVMSALFLLCIAASGLARDLGARAGVSDTYFPYVINTVPVQGYVAKLIVPEESPNLLYALVWHNRHAKPTDKAGLHIYNISDVRRINQITHLPISSPSGMDMSRDAELLRLSWNWTSPPLR